MAKILRGDIFWADLNPAVGHEQAGWRPVVILSREFFNFHSGTVIAMALTSQLPSVNYPLTLKLESLQLPKESWAKIGQIRTLSTLRLKGKLGNISSEELKKLIAGLNRIISD